MQNTVYERKQNGEDFILLHSVTDIRFGNCPANGFLNIPLPFAFSLLGRILKHRSFQTTYVQTSPACFFLHSLSLSIETQNIFATLVYRSCKDVFGFRK